MSCHSCGPGAAQRKQAKAMAKEMKKELTDNIQTKMKRDLEEKLDVYTWKLQNTRIWRELRFLTQEDLAELAGVSAATIRQFEQGHRQPTEKLTAAGKIERAIRRYPVREDPNVHCCSGLRGMIDRHWIRPRLGIAENEARGSMLTPDRLYFIIEIRGQDTNIILHHCPSCGEHLYPAPISDVGDRESSEKKK